MIKYFLDRFFDDPPTGSGIVIVLTSAIAVLAFTFVQTVTAIFPDDNHLEKRVKALELRLDELQPELQKMQPTD